MKTLKEILVEKTLTDDELQKREEVAKAIERDHPDMPTDKKMAIATSVAIRTEGVVRKQFSGTVDEFQEEMSKRGGTQLNESVSGKTYFVCPETKKVVGTLDKTKKAFFYESK